MLDNILKFCKALFFLAITGLAIVIGMALLDCFIL